MNRELDQAMKYKTSAGEDLKIDMWRRRMQTGKLVSNAVVLSVVACAVAACSVASTRQTAPVTLPEPQIVSVDGEWTDSDGISTSSFRNGIFETRSSDTFEKLSEGNYVMRSDNLVDIEMRSLVRGTVSRINCTIRHATVPIAQSSQLSQGAPQLMCTSQDGTRFTLHRQEGGRPLPGQASL